MNAKYRLENFSFYDHTGIARHLEQMAAKGWLLEKAGRIWKYRAIPPKKVAFTVTYCAHASVFDPEPTEAQQQFIDLCAHTGWVAVPTTGQMQIFYNEDPSAPPLNTEPTVELEGMHRAMKKNFLPATVLLLLCTLVILRSIVRGSGMVNVLTSGTMLFGTAMIVMSALYFMMQLVSYLLYRRKAKKAAELGIFPEVAPSDHLRNKIWLGCLWALLLCTALHLWNGSYRDRMLVLTSLVFVAALYTLYGLIVWVLKKCRAPANFSRIAYVILAFIVYFGLSAVKNGYLDQLPLPQVEEPIPFSLTAYDGRDYGTPTVRKNTSPFAQRLSVTQSAQSVGLYYTLTTAKSETMAQYLLQTVHRGRKDGSFKGIVSIANHYKPTDPAQWQADEAYRLTWGDGPIGHYLIRWDNVVLDVEYWDNATGESDVPAELRDMLIETFQP